MSLNKTALRAAQDALRLRDVFFRDEAVSVRGDITPPLWPEHAHTQFKMATRVLHDFQLSDSEEPDAASRRLLEIEFVGEVRCLAEAAEEGASIDAGEAIFSLKAHLGLLYEVVGELPTDGLEEFVRANVPYHAIPYWREHVHSTCTRRRFAPITVPMYARPLEVDPRGTDDVPRESQD